MISIKSNVQCLLLLAGLALPEILWVFWQTGTRDRNTELIIGFVLLSGVLFPFIAELLHWVYRHFSEVLYRTGNLKKVLLSCWLIAPVVSVLALFAYVGGLFAMGLVGFFLWRDWKKWGQTPAGVRPNNPNSLDPNTQFYFLMAALVVPFPALWWLLEQGGFAPESLVTGRAILALNLYFVPFIAQLFFDQYRRVRSKLYRTNRAKEVLLAFGADAPSLAMSAMLAYIGGLLAMGLIGFFLWRDWKDLLCSGSAPPEEPDWAPFVGFNLAAPLKIKPRFFILIGAFLFPLPGAVTIFMWDENDFFLFRLIILPVALFFFPPVGRLCWTAYLWISEPLQRGKQMQDMLPRYLTALLCLPLIISVPSYLFIPGVGLFIGVGSLSAMLAIGYFLWQDEKELLVNNGESLNTEG